MAQLFRSLSVLCVLISVSLNTYSGDQEQTFLDVDKAFQFSFEQTASGFALSFDIAPGYYLYKERFKFKPNDVFANDGAVGFSKPGKAKNDPYFGPVHIYHDDLGIELILLDDTISQNIELAYQGCAEAGLCYPPVKKKLNFTPEIVPAPKQTDTHDLESSDGVMRFLGSKDLLTICGIFFLLGIGLTFTPCVFPMIPIISAVITGQKNPTTLRSFKLALSYVLGMAITYSAAGVATGLLGAKANLQTAFQNPIVLLVIAAIFVALALSMFGIYEIQLPEKIRDKINNKSQSLQGGQVLTVFAIGALSALVVSPCVSAPLAGALLYISSTGNAMSGGLSLLALGLGMGVPLILIAVGGGKFLPKAGAWMERTKNVFGIMLLAIALWLLGRVVEPVIQMATWALFLIVIASYLGIFESSKTAWDKFTRGLGMFIFAIGVLLLIGLGSGSRNILQPLDQLAWAQTGFDTNIRAASNKQKLSFNTVYSLEQLNSVIKQANQQSLPVMVDFYADWCVSCKVMEKEIFAEEEIGRSLDQVYLIKADITQNDDKSLELLEHYNLFGPPSLIFYGKSGTERRELRISGETSLDVLQSRLDNILGKS